MTNGLYIIARLTMNSPNYQGKLHAMPYMGLEPINAITDEAMRMLEPEFPAVEYVTNTIRHIGDRMLEADVIHYKAKFAEIEHIQDQRAALEHHCYLVGLEMGLCRHRLQDVHTIQCIIEEMVQDQWINRTENVRWRGGHGHGRPT